VWERGNERLTDNAAQPKRTPRPSTSPPSASSQAIPTLIWSGRRF